MGCKFSSVDVTEEVYLPTIEFKSKYENIVYKLKSIKERAEKKSDTKTASNAEWIIQTLQEGDLYEVEYNQEMQNDDMNTDIRKKENSNMKEAMEVLAHYSDAHYKMRLGDDAQKYNLANPMKVRKPVKYAGFINKFKRSLNNIISSLERNMTLVIKDLSTEQIKQLAKSLSKIESHEFDVFELNSLIENKTLHFTLNQILNKFVFFKESVSEELFSNFIMDITAGYDRKVPYHNDLHATDVLQTTNVLIEKGNLVGKLQLNELDVIATLIAATCHDFRHNGFNNLYHMNIQSDIAIIYNDVSVLENYHVSETFKTLMKKDHNIFENLRPEEYRVVRRRMIEGILSTDMATHAKNLLSIRSKLESLGIKGGLNVEKLLVPDNASKNFEHQQLILNQCIHTSDLSNPAKLPQVYSRWTELIFLEFFNQGDLEKAKGLPVSMLCDRTTVKVNKSQVGFISFVVLPQFEMMLNIMPEVQPYLDALMSNLKVCDLKAKDEE